MSRGFRHPAACRSVRERTPTVNRGFRNAASTPRSFFSKVLWDVEADVRTIGPGECVLSPRQAVTG
jgi:hypothetical protein